MKRLALLLPLLALSTVLVLASCLGTGCVLMANLGLMRLDSERRLSIRERVAAGDLSVLDKVRKSDVNYVFDDGGSLLLAAVSSCDSNMVAALIARGADVNQPFEDPRYSEFDRFDTSRVGQTPLHWAVGRMVARDLFRHPEKADRAHPVRVGLHVKELNLHDLEDRQVETNLIAIVSILLENGAKPDVRTEGWFNERQTALAYALALEDPYPVLDILIKGGSDPNQLVLACQSLPDSMERDLAWWQKRHGDRSLSAEESARMEKTEKLIRYLRNAAEPKPHAENAENAATEPHAEPAENESPISLDSDEEIR